MTEMIKRFLREEEGATMVEYGLMVAAIAAICIAIVFSVGKYVKGSFTDLDTAMSTNGVTKAN